MGRWNTEYPEDRLGDETAEAMPFDAEERAARRLLRLEDPRPRTMGPAPVWWPGPGAVAPAAAARVAREEVPAAAGVTHETTDDDTPEPRGLSRPAWAAPVRPIAPRPASTLRTVGAGPRAAAPHDEAAAPPHDESPAQRQERIARDRAVYGPLVQARTAAQRELEEHGPAPEIFDRALRNLESAATHDPALQPRLQYTQAAARQWHAEHPRYADARARRDRADAEIRARAAAQAGRRTAPPEPRGNIQHPMGGAQPSLTSPPTDTRGPVSQGPSDLIRVDPTLPEAPGAQGDKGSPGRPGAPGASERLLGDLFLEQQAKKPHPKNSGFSLYPVSAPGAPDKGDSLYEWGDVVPGDQGAQVETTDGRSGQIKEANRHEVTIRTGEGKEYKVPRREVRLKGGLSETPKLIHPEVPFVSNQDGQDGAPLPPLEPEANTPPQNTPVEPPADRETPPPATPPPPSPQANTPPPPVPPVPPSPQTSIPPTPTPPLPPPGSQRPLPPNFPPQAPSEKIPDSDFLPSVKAAAAEGTLRTASGAARVLANTPMTVEEILDQWESPLGQLRKGLEALERMASGETATQGTTATGPGQLDRPPSPSRLGLDPLKRAIAHVDQLARDTAKRIARPIDEKIRQGRHLGNRVADQIDDTADNSYQHYGADPRSQNAGAQFGRALGDFLHLTPAMMSGGAPAIAQLGVETYGGAYLDTARELRAHGVRDPEEIRRHAAAAARAVTTMEAPKLGLMVLAGRYSSRVVGRTLPGSAGVARRVASTTGAAFITNVTVGAVLRALETGHWEVNIQTLTSDALFAIFQARGDWQAASAQVRQRADAELTRRTQVYNAATPRERQNALVAAIHELPQAERDLIHRAHRQLKAKLPLSPAEDLALKKAQRNAEENAMGMRSHIPTTLPPEVKEYSDKYYQAVAGKPQDFADLLAGANDMAKNHPAGRHLKFKYNAKEGSSHDSNTIHLRPEARRVDFVEEFSHWRMKHGDQFLAKEQRAFRKKLSAYRHLKERGMVAEELAIKTYMIENYKKLGLEPVDVEYLTNQIQSLYKYGTVWY